MKLSALPKVGARRVTRSASQTGWYVSWRGQPEKEFATNIDSAWVRGFR